MCTWQDNIQRCQRFRGRLKGNKDTEKRMLPYADVTKEVAPVSTVNSKERSTALNGGRSAFFEVQNGGLQGPFLPPRI